MTDKIDIRFLADDGRELFDGNELLVKGALETPGGVHLMTGYPGSPVATFFDKMGDIKSLLLEKGIRATIANNEATSVAMVNGSQMVPARAMAVMKSVGLHVASDGLALGNLAGPDPNGGAVIVSGDDPWTDSTQVPADSRYLFEHLRMPIIQPTSPQEIKDFVPLAFDLSMHSGLYCGYLITTIQADGGGTVSCRPNQYPEHNTLDRISLETASLDLEHRVLLPPRTGQQEEDLTRRYGLLLDRARQLGINHVVGPKGHCRVGFVTSGMTHDYLCQALNDLHMADEFAILKLGLVYPVDPQAIAELAQRVDYIVVIEEQRGFIEQHINTILSDLRQNDPDTACATLWGKRFPGKQNGFSATRGLNASIVASEVSRLCDILALSLSDGARTAVQQFRDHCRQDDQRALSLTKRIPSFCPGCPHRDSSNVLLEVKKQFMDPEYMRTHHHRSPTDLVFHGDTGCYTMLMFPPNEQLMHNYSGMGLGGATGAGIDPFITNKQVVFMGDSTFFHSGQATISNSIKHNQDITYIILENKTTAMTGHQPTPGIETDLMGQPTSLQDIEQICRALVADAGAYVVRTNPEDREFYKRLLERTILSDGVKIIIADKECGITYYRRLQRAERAEQHRTGFLAKKTYMNVTPEVCEYCLECTTRTGCPGLAVEQTNYGPKIVTDLSWCVNDGACARIDACPSFEEVTVVRSRPPRPRGHQITFERLPEPQVDTSRSVWRAYLAGVGGMGIGVAAAILVRAGHLEGYDVVFADKKGLAIRNGGVYSQVTFHKSGQTVSQSIPYGQADLLMGVDILEACRATDPKLPYRVASPQRTAAVINSYKAATISSLMNTDDFDPAGLEEQLRKVTRPDAYISHNVAAITERLFGTKLYANITMLGVAYQAGLIPVSLDSLQHAISSTLRKADFKKNMRAFNLGRKLVAEPEQFGEPQVPQTLARLVREKANIIRRRTILRPRRTARRYKYLVFKTLRSCRELDKQTMRDIAIRLYDLTHYGGHEYATHYARVVRTTFLRDDPEKGYAATRAVVWNLAKMMLIKDEFFVAHLLTSYEKVRRDTHRYNVNAANGDRIRYKRVFHPRIFGRKVEVSFLPHWSLHVMKRLRFLRSWIPGYHREDLEFLAWYEGIVANFSYQTASDYDTYVQVLNLPEQVRGYREYRTPKMEHARQEAQRLLSQGGKSGGGGPSSPSSSEAVPVTGSRKSGSLTSAVSHSFFARLGRKSGN